MGLQNARGEWIGFLDDDDLYELVPQRLQEDVLPERKSVKMKIQFTKNGGTKLTHALFMYLDSAFVSAW